MIYQPRVLTLQKETKGRLVCGVSLILFDFGGTIAAGYAGVLLNQWAGYGGGYPAKALSYFVIWEN